jgi:uncharacterized protein (DUF2141 family)/Fe-S cluster assembly iron-binding protein IscA
VVEFYVVMRKIYFIILFVILSLLVTISGCAKRGTISGGLKDTIPPKIIGSSPENYKTNFTGKEIKIVFDELIKVKDITKQLIISPPMKTAPIIVPQGSASKYISIKIQDTLQENTTYSFNFGQSITDNNEGNPYSQFKYIFSTGSYFDSLTVVGKIKDAYNQKPDNFVSVMLYDAKTFKDSTVYKETPLYVTNTLDSLKVFSLENLRESEYYIVALKDKNGNNKFDPKSDKIGFLKDPIKTPTEIAYQLELFAEKPAFKAEKPIQQSTNKFFMAYSGNTKNLKVKAKAGSKDIDVKLAQFPQTGKDSVQLFLPKIESDSIEFFVDNDNYSKSFVSKYKELKESDTLKLEVKKSGVLKFRDNFILKSSTPLVEFDKSKMKLINKDSVSIEFTTKYSDFIQELEFDFVKEENEKYILELLPGAIVDFYGMQNDTLTNRITTSTYADYGNLRLNLQNVNRFPLIVELLDSKAKVMAYQISTKETILNFDLIDPMLYTVRIIYDDNTNGEWDTGNFLEKKQAEEVIYFPKEIDVRANWDVEQEINLGG